MTTPDNEKQPAQYGKLSCPCDVGADCHIHGEDPGRERAREVMRAKVDAQIAKIDAAEQPAASGLTKDWEQRIRADLSRDVVGGRYVHVIRDDEAYEAMIAHLQCDLQLVLDELDRLRTTPQPAALSEERLAEIRKELHAAFKPLHWPRFCNETAHVNVAMPIFEAAWQDQQAAIRSLEQQLADKWGDGYISKSAAKLLSERTEQLKEANRQLAAERTQRHAGQD